MSQVKARTLVAALVALLVVAVAYFGVIAMIARNAEKPEPELTAYSHGKSVTVQPYQYCDVQMQNCKILPAEDMSGFPVPLECAAGQPDCHTGKPVDLRVPGGDPLQLSLPKDIAGKPWLITAIYRTPSGATAQNTVSFQDYDKGTVAVTIPSLKELKLVVVEVQLPILVRDTTTGQEGYLPHQAWSIHTEV